MQSVAKSPGAPRGEGGMRLHVVRSPLPVKFNTRDESVGKMIGGGQDAWAGV